LTIRTRHQVVSAKIMHIYYISNSCTDQINSKVINTNIYTHYDMGTYRYFKYKYTYRTLAPIKLTRKSTKTSSTIISITTVTAFNIGFPRTAGIKDFCLLRIPSTNSSMHCELILLTSGVMLVLFSI
jgi:hypothetical protein